MLKMSLTKQLIYAILIGSFLGILLGSFCSVFEPIGKAFVMIIEMVVLLYIPSSIIHGLGSTRPTVARALFRKGWLFLLFIWALILCAVYLMNLIFPSMNILFSGTGDHSTFEINFLNYLVPENPLYDIVNNIIPAIAIFAIIMGVAVMHLTHKEPLISFLERINDVMEQVLKGITKISPIGVLAIFATFSGTIRLTDLKALNFYVIPMIAISLALTFWVLPALVVSCTSLKYKEVMEDIRSSCFLAFLIGSPSIAIPFLYRVVKNHAEKFEIKDKELHNTSQMIVPIAYTFTQVGNLFILFFIMYLSYHFRHQLAGAEEGMVSAMTILMSFGGPELALNSINFLIETLGFPSSALKIYDNASIVTQNFQILISVASMVVFVTLLLLGYYKRLTFRPSYFFKNFFPFFFLLVITVIGAKTLIREYVPIQNFTKEMTIQTDFPIETNATVYKFGQKLPSDSDRQAIQDTLDRIYTTQTLYVGYHPDLPPFSYFNDDGKLVGFNITYAHKLAHDMNVKLVFIPCYYNNLGTALRTNLIDIAMSPILLSEATVKNMNFPHYYLETSNVMIVPQSRKEEFRNFNRIKENPYLVIGVIGLYQEILNRILPIAQSVQVEHIEKIDALLTEGKVDAILWTKEQGMDYCRSHPEYVVIEYGPNGGSSYLSYPVKYHALGFILFLNRWLAIQEQIGFKKEQYNYWVDGAPPEKKEPRWCLIRNVFHLIK